MSSITPANWSVTPIGYETVEIVNPEKPELVYLVRASKRFLRIDAVENGRLVEQNWLTRGVHEFIFEAFDTDGDHIRIAIAPGSEVITAHVIANDEEFELVSPAGEFAFRLHQSLSKRTQPKNERIGQLAAELDRRGATRADLESNSQFGQEIMAGDIPNGVMAACAAACFLCALGSFPSCVACAICIEMQTESGETIIA